MIRNTTHFVEIVKYALEGFITNANEAVDYNMPNQMLYLYSAMLEIEIRSIVYFGNLTNSTENFGTGYLLSKYIKKLNRGIRIFFGLLLF